MNVYNFQAELLKKDGMDACYILFPYDVEKEFGTKGQVKVKAVFDGKAEYRGSLANMGLDSYCLGVTKKIRILIGKNPGESIHVMLHKDTEPRVVDIPADVEHVLREEELMPFFMKKSYSQQKKWVEPITAAKKEETRMRRIKQLINQLKHQ